MTQLVQAIYENGVFQPLAPVQVAERVSLVIESGTVDQVADVVARQREALNRLRAEMDEIPSNASLDGLGGADHDRILYGG